MTILDKIRKKFERLAAVPFSEHDSGRFGAGRIGC